MTEIMWSRHYAIDVYSASQKRLPPRLIGCLAPRLVDGAAATSSLSSELLGLEATCFALFVGGLAGGSEDSDTAVSVAGFSAPLDCFRFEVE